MINNFYNLIPFSVDNENNIFVSAKNLYRYLGIKTPFRAWFEEIIEYGFEENIDYKRVNKNKITSNKGQVDFLIKINMAKEIAMLQRGNRARSIFKYFVSLEKRLKIVQRTIKNILNTGDDFYNFDDFDDFDDLPQDIDTYENEIIPPANSCTTNFRDTAKILGVRENLLVNWLLLNNYCYRDKKGIIKPYAKYMEFFQMRDFITDSGHSGTQTLINSKGREEFKSMLIEENVIENSDMKLFK